MRRIAMLAVMLAAPPWVAARAQGGEEVTLTVEGEVPEGHFFGLDYPVDSQNTEGRDDLPLCTTAPNGGDAGPECEDGGTYSVSVEVPAGEPVSFDVIRYSIGGSGPERFYTNTRAFPGDATESAVYVVPADLAPAVVADAEEAGAGGAGSVGEQRSVGESAGDGETTGRRPGGEGSTPEETGDSGVAVPEAGVSTLVLVGIGLLALAGGALIYRALR